MDIGTALKMIRKKKGYTQKQLADKCGLSQTAISNLEKGVSFITKTNLHDICKELGVPVAYVLFLSISEEDIPESKRALFDALGGPLKQALLEEVQ